jgi:dTDP-4-dehydrorhamnose reductase
LDNHYAFNQMRVLITGAGGMLGVDVGAAALAAGHEVVALPRADLDITDAAAVDAAVTAATPDLVINCAAFTNVDAAQGDGRDAAHLINGVGAGHIASAAATGGAWLVHVSTDYVFDGAKTTGPYLESDGTAPQSVYGASKLEGELAVAQAAPLSHTIVRSSWLFGNHGGCFPATMLRLATEQESLSVVDDQRGCPTFTPDLAQALLAVASQQLLGVVHIAAGGECTWFEFARETILAAGLRAVVSPCTTAEFPRPAPRPVYSVLRSGRSEAPVLRDWREGLREYLDSRAPTEVSVP